MIKTTPPPKIKNNNQLVVPFLYAAFLMVLALVQLMGFGGFDFAGISYETEGMASIIIAIAAAEIFSLPFLLRLNLSPLARAVSAVLSMAVPLLFLSNAVFMRVEVSIIELLFGVLLALLAVGSHKILDGDKAMRLSK